MGKQDIESMDRTTRIIFRFVLVWGSLAWLALMLLLLAAARWVWIQGSTA